jgi:hypothetical protein
MTIPSDAELHTERLLDVVNNPDPRALAGMGSYDRSIVIFTRLLFARTMLALAVKLEAGVKPGVSK